MVALENNPIANLPDWSDSRATYPADKIRNRIFYFAGREATFAYQIATCGKETTKPYIQENAFCEPFTYWDWLEKDASNKWTTTDPQAENKRKRRLFWERERGFRVNGGEWESYPSPKKRWEDFKSRVDDGNRHFVKKIAMAGWMTTDEFGWIARELPQLEALDLSNLVPVSDKALEALDPVLKKLKWLSLTNVTACRTSGILRHCTQLETLSLRTSYSEANPSISLLRDDATLQSLPAGIIHQGICQLILIIEQHVPFSVKTLELRQPVACMHHFLKRLDALRAKNKTQIERIGIDLGAWIHMYPLRSQSSRQIVDIAQLADSESIRYRVAQAAERIVKTAQTLEESQLTAEPQGKLPLKANYNELIAEGQEKSNTLNKEIPPSTHRDSRHDYYINRDGTFIDQECSSPESKQSLQAEQNCTLDAAPMHKSSKDTLSKRKANTLLRMLYSLWEAHLVSKKSITLFGLSPEAEERSFDPIQPFALIQTADEAGIGAGVTFRDIGPHTDLTYLYSWLNTTFQWRPVFDWDCFMVPDGMHKAIDHSYKSILNDEPNYMELIETQFKSLRRAAIPLNLIIGRRNPNQSSCYWGWPYQKETWEDWLLRKFDANLDNIATIVDSLSIFYDLRNPIDQRHLEDIEAIDPFKSPSAFCPKRPCPWQRKTGQYSDSCPFKRHQTPLDQLTASNDGQKMANKRWLNKMLQIPTSYGRPSNAGGSVPPVGENANDHASDDSDCGESSDIAAKIPLQYLARRAAFAREAVGWHRFWSTYALKFTSLAMLRVRMPRHFDQISSWRLARLLDQKKGWTMLVYTDERQHLQTAEDLVGYVGGGPVKTPAFEHLPEAKTLPAGRFVRRSWIWSEQYKATKEANTKIAGQLDVELIGQPYSENARRVFKLEDWDSTAIHEEEEFQAAQKWAEHAARKEEEVRVQLSADIDQQMKARDQGRPTSDIHRHLIQQYAQQEWENTLQHRIDQFDQELERVVASLKQPSTSNDDAAQLRQQERLLKARISWLQARIIEDVPILIQGEDTLDGREGSNNIPTNRGPGEDVQPQVPSRFADDPVTAQKTTNYDLQKPSILPGIPVKLPGLGSLNLPYPTQSLAAAPSQPQPVPTNTQPETTSSPEGFGHSSLTQNASNPKLTTGVELRESPPKKRKATSPESASGYPDYSSPTLETPNPSLNAGTEPVEAPPKKRKVAFTASTQETKQPQPRKPRAARTTTRGTEPSPSIEPSPKPNVTKETLSKKPLGRKNQKPNLDVIDEEPDKQSGDDTGGTEPKKVKGKGKANMKKRHSRQEYRPKGGRKTEAGSPVARRTRSHKAERGGAT